MNMHHAFIADRKLALHCAELLRPKTDAEQPLARLDMFGSSIAQQIAISLGSVCGLAPNVESGLADAITIDQLAKIEGPQAKLGLIAVGPERVPILASFDTEAAFIMIDQAFGGNGNVQGGFPDPLPASATLMISQIHGAITSALAAVFASNVHFSAQEVKPKSVTCFAPRAPLATTVFAVKNIKGQDWRIRLTMEHSKISHLPHVSHDQDISDGVSKAILPIRGPLSKPFADIALNLRAVLVNCEIPVSQIAHLQRGQVLPVTIARSVPLWVEGAEFAKGTVGTVDENTAFKIKTILRDKRNGQ